MKVEDLVTPIVSSSDYKKDFAADPDLVATTEKKSRRVLKEQKQK